MDMDTQPNQICDLLQVPCKPSLIRFMVGLSATKPSLPPSFLVKRVFGYGHPAGLKQNLSKGGELLVSQWPSISCAQLCLRTSSCSWVSSY